MPDLLPATSVAVAVIGALAASEGISVLKKVIDQERSLPATTVLIGLLPQFTVTVLPASAVPLTTTEPLVSVPLRTTPRSVVPATLKTPLITGASGAVMSTYLIARLSTGDVVVLLPVGSVAVTVYSRTSSAEGVGFSIRYTLPVFGSMLNRFASRPPMV